MLLLPFAETKGSWVSTKDLELHCWYAHDVFSIAFIFFMLMILLCLTTDITTCVVQGVGPNIAISFSVYESLRSFWQSRR